MKKKAQDLQPGDVVVTPSHRLVVTQVDKDGFVWAARSGEPYAPLANIRFQEDVEVESPALTPAQQHADELLQLVREMAGVLKYRHTMTDADFEAHRAGHVDRTHDLLARIDPPKAPTVEELAQALDDSINCRPGTLGYDNAVSVLERARASGMLK